MLDVSVW